MPSSFHVTKFTSFRRHFQNCTERNTGMAPALTPQLASPRSRRAGWREFRSIFSGQKWSSDPRKPQRGLVTIHQHKKRLSSTPRMNLLTSWFFGWMDETVMVYQIQGIHSFFFLLFFAFLKMVLSSVSKFISDLCLNIFFSFLQFRGILRKF